MNMLILQLAQILDSMEDAAAVAKVETESSEVQTKLAIHQHLQIATNKGTPFTEPNMLSSYSMMLL